MTCFTFFTSQWHSKNAYKSEVFTGNNFQNKAQWFDSFMCCFCCFFRRREIFKKATNDSYKTPLVQSFAVTALGPKMRYTLIYEHFFLHHNWGSLMCCFIFEVHLRVTRNNYILQVMILKNFFYFSVLKLLLNFCLHSPLVFQVLPSSLTHN